jgi:hypothetical protein
MNSDVLRGRYTRPLAGSLLAALGLAMLATPMPVHADEFPFGHELLLDASPMRGSKKMPILDIGDAGAAEIELWCNSVKAQLVIAGHHHHHHRRTLGAPMRARPRPRRRGPPRRAQRRHQLADGTLRAGAHRQPHATLPRGDELSAKSSTSFRGRPKGGTRNPDGLATCTAWIPGSRKDARPGMTTKT